MNIFEFIFAIAISAMLVIMFLGWFVVCCVLNLLIWIIDQLLKIF